MDQYLVTLQNAIRNFDTDDLDRVVDVLYQAYWSGNRVFTMGNGASAALASHMACDLGKGTALDVGTGVVDSRASRLKIISLTDNVSLISAYGNDVQYEDIFVEQLKNLLEPRDVVIAISGSGGSPNVLRAMQYAQMRHAVTIGFTGMQPSNEKLSKLCDIVVRAPLTMMEQIEDMHVMFHHVVAISLRDRIAERPCMSQDTVPGMSRLSVTSRSRERAAKPTVAASA
jgi:D-sedoheptulose 7-phosphate isomerase